jgi:DNA-binding NarL/FixJ family response regulator
MRLLVVGAPRGRLTLAARLAAQNGADIIRAVSVADALKLLSAGHPDVVLIDAALAIRDLVKGLKKRPRDVPVIACGTVADAGVALAAVRAGASEYLPLSANLEEAAALIAALARGNRASSRHVRTASKAN